MSYNELIHQLRNRAAMPDVPSSDVRLLELAARALCSYGELARAQEQGRLTIDGKHDSGMKDSNGVEVLEGTKVISVTEGTFFEVKYGLHMAYCPVAKTFVPTMGFYLLAQDGAQLPLDNLSEWARISTQK